jgi:hypothetical protein
VKAPEAPDAALHRTGKEGAAYLRDLLAAAGMTQAAAARAVGVDPRTMRRYLSADAGARLDAPYAVQFALERLAVCAGHGKRSTMSARAKGATMKGIALVAALLAAAAGYVRADDLIVTWPGGGALVYADGQIVDVQEGAEGGTVYFQTNNPPTHTQTDRLFVDGFEPKRWDWWVFEHGGPGHGTGMCTMSRSASTVILDCAGD